MLKNEERIAEVKRRIGEKERQQRQSVCAAFSAVVLFLQYAVLPPQSVPHLSAFVIPSRFNNPRKRSFPRYTIFVICFTLYPITSAAC